MNQQDFLRRFLFEERGIRGEWIQLTDSWQRIKKSQHTPDVVQQLLGQAVAAVTMLSAMIKFEGSLILQAQGDGDIKMVVAQCTHDGKIRGLSHSVAEVSSGTLESMFGSGRLVLTIKPDHSEPYQGIIALEGKNLASALENYFNQSEQLRTRLWLFANEHSVAGLMLQELPNNQHTSDWEHIEILANTLTEQEMMMLSCQQILTRLFHEENIRLFDAEPIQFACTCSRDKIERTLKNLGADELYDILHERGNIEVDCDFCNTQYQFDKIDIAQLLSNQDTGHLSTTRH